MPITAPEPIATPKSKRFAAARLTALRTMEEPWLEEKSVVKRVQMDSAPPAMSDTNG